MFRPDSKANPNPAIKAIVAHVKIGKIEPGSRSVDVLRVVVKTMMEFNKVPGIESCDNYTRFFQAVAKTAILAKMREEFTSENKDR